MTFLTLLTSFLGAFFGVFAAYGLTLWLVKPSSQQVEHREVLKQDVREMENDPAYQNFKEFEKS